MAVSVYWIRANHHTDITLHGYVGITNNVIRRFDEHSKSSSCSNRHLRLAIKKYGWKNLKKDVVVISDLDYCLAVENKLRPKECIGWNLVAGGGNPPVLRGERVALKGRIPWNKGKKSSDATREKIRVSVTEQMKDPKRREINRNTHLGKPSHRKGTKISETTRMKMILSRTGIPSKKKGIPVSSEVIERIVIAVRSCKWVCPHCNTEGFGKGAMNRWHFDKCKSKIIGGLV